MTTEEFIKSLIIGLLNLGIIILGSYLVVDDKITLASLITYIMLTNYLFSPIHRLKKELPGIKHPGSSVFNNRSYERNLT